MKTLSSLIFISVFSFSLSPLFCHGYVDKIPFPNRCTQDSAISWASNNCPVNAQCVPGKNGSESYYYCACGYSPDMLLQSTDGICYPSASTYVYAMYFVCLTITCAFLACHLSWNLYRTYTADALKFNFFNMSCCLALCSAILEIIHRAVRIALLLKKYDRDRYMMLNRIHLICLAFFSFTTISTIIIFGLAVYAFAKQSAHLHPVNQKMLNKKVFLFAGTVGGSMLAGCMFLLVINQHAINQAYTALFCLTLWVFYNRVLSQIRGLTPNNKSRRSTSPRVSFGLITFTPTVSVGNNHNSQQSDAGFNIVTTTEMTMLQVELLSSRLVLILFMYTLNAIAYNIVWFTGIHHRHKPSLSFGIAVMTGVHFGIMTTGIAFVAIFSHNITRFRIAKLQHWSEHGDKVNVHPSAVSMSTQHHHHHHHHNDQHTHQHHTVELDTLSPGTTEEHANNNNNLKHDDHLQDFDQDKQQHSP